MLGRTHEKGVGDGGDAGKAFAQPDFNFVGERRIFFGNESDGLDAAGSSQENGAFAVKGLGNDDESFLPEDYPGADDGV